MFGKTKLAVALIGVFGLVAAAHATPYSFGVMSDTQWKSNLDGLNANTVAEGIIKQVNQQFISSGVKFVVQVGDLTDNGSTAAMNTRAAAAQELYNAGIGFMPLRGNHESSAAAAKQFQSLYPQTQGLGVNALVGASNFSSPSTNLNGLSYSFNYNNTKFVFLDQFTPTSGSQSTLTQAQVNWVGTTLADKPANANAFVFSHKGLITQNHADNLFGSNPAAQPALQNQFINSLQQNNVRYLIGGHDHMHQRSVIASPDGASAVHELTTASNSYKFYTPVNPSVDSKYNLPTRETTIAQQLFTVGYYVFTVDGPRVTADFYSSPNGCNGDCDLTKTPSLTFTKQETFGYSLNGKQFQVAAGASFAGVNDSIAAGGGFLGTEFKVLAGTNSGDVSNAYDSRPTVADVSTGWTSFDEIANPKMRSDKLSLWGASDLSNSSSNTLRIELSYTGADPVEMMTLDASGNWIVAGTARGFDAATHTAWAEVKLSATEVGQFAVQAVPEPESYAMLLAGLGLIGFVARRSAKK